jgi:hypothetical protein
MSHVVQNMKPISLISILESLPKCEEGLSANRPERRDLTATLQTSSAVSRPDEPVDIGWHQSGDASDQMWFEDPSAHRANEQTVMFGQPT